MNIRYMGQTRPSSAPPESVTTWEIAIPEEYQQSARERYTYPEWGEEHQYLYTVGPSGEKVYQGVAKYDLESGDFLDFTETTKSRPILNVDDPESIPLEWREEYKHVQEIAPRYTPGRIPGWEELQKRVTTREVLPGGEVRITTSIPHEIDPMEYLGPVALGATVFMAFFR